VVRGDAGAFERAAESWSDCSAPRLRYALHLIANDAWLAVAQITLRAPWFWSLPIAAAAMGIPAHASRPRVALLVSTRKCP
jgi:hypothetical protein